MALKTVRIRSKEAACQLARKQGSTEEDRARFARLLVDESRERAERLINNKMERS